MNKDIIEKTDCTHEHEEHTHDLRSEHVIQQTSVLFRALRSCASRLMELFFDGSHCVPELAHETDESMSLIFSVWGNFVSSGFDYQKRTGKHIYYSLADDHVITLLVMPSNTSKNTKTRGERHE